MVIPDTTLGHPGVHFCSCAVKKPVKCFGSLRLPGKHEEALGQLELGVFLAIQSQEVV